MKFLIQRVLEASVKVDGETVGSIGKGLLVFVGAGREDDRAAADKYLKKLLGLRIFEDENGKTNLSLKDVNGELLFVSQFTLYANCKKATVPASSKQAIRIQPTNCTNIFSVKPQNLFPLFSMEYSEPI